MTTWFEIGLSNALAATALAVLACVVSRLWPRPQVVFAVWVLVLAKLVAPPLVALPVENLREYLTSTPPIAPHEATDLPAAAVSDFDPLPTDEQLSSELLAATADADLAAELQYGVLESEEIGQFDESIAALSSSEMHFPFSDEVMIDDVAPVAAEPVTVTGVLLAAWLTGSSLWFALAAARILRFRRLLRLARPATQALQTEVRRLAARMHLRSVPEVRTVRRRVSPLVWALAGQATLLLPDELLRRLTVDQRATLLAHELAHLKRRDHLVRLLELAALGLFWWHPVAWWARRNAERAAEYCCDAQVIELFPAQARAYALALWTTVDFLSDAPAALPLGASGFSQARHVKRRMEMILATSPARRVGRPLRLLLLLIGLAVLPLSLRSLWAEPPAAAAPQSKQEEFEVTLEGDGVASDASLAGTVVLQEHQVQAASDPFAATVVVEESKTKPPGQGIAFFVGTQEIEEQNGKPVQKTPSIEERLDRLEKMIQALAERPVPVKASAATTRISITKKARAREKEAPGGVDSPPVETPKPAKDVDDPFRGTDEKHAAPESPFDDRNQSPDAGMNLSHEDATDLGLEAGHRLVEIVRRATMNLELSKTNSKRFEAATRQLREVKKAYEADTVSLDQVLESQRRVVEAYLAYVRVTADLSTDPRERHLLVAKAALAATNHALKDARETWKRVHQVATPGSAEEKSEAQAREQYNQLKMQANTLLNEYHWAEAAFKHGAAARGEVDAETQRELAAVAGRYKWQLEEVRKHTQDKLKMAAEETKKRMIEAERIQAQANEEIEKAKREAEEARRMLELFEKRAKLSEQQADTAAKKAEAAARQLEDLEKAAKEQEKSGQP